MPEYRRQSRNWYMAMGVLFIVSAAIVFMRQILLVWPFFFDNITSGDITSEKISIGMVAFGLFLFFYGYRITRQRI